MAPVFRGLQVGSPSSPIVENRTLRQGETFYEGLKVPKARRYIFTPEGARTAVLLDKLRRRLFAPVLAVATAAPQQHPSSKQLRRPGPAPERPPMERLCPLLHKHAGNVSAVAREMKRQRCVVIRWIKREQIDVGAYRKPVDLPVLDDAYEAVAKALDGESRTLALQWAS